MLHKDRLIVIYLVVICNDIIFLFFFSFHLKILFLPIPGDPYVALSPWNDGSRITYIISYKCNRYASLSTRSTNTQINLRTDERPVRHSPRLCNLFYVHFEQRLDGTEIPIVRMFTVGD